jgi:hypothetical protein
VVASFENVTDPGDWAATERAFDQRPDDDSHHMVEEAVADDGYSYELASALDRDAVESAHGGFGAAGLSEGTEVVFSEQRLGGFPHRLEIERQSDVMSVAPDQRAWFAAVQNGIDVGARFRAKAGREAIGDDGNVTHRAIPRERPAQGQTEATEGKVRTGCERDDLTGRVNTAVSPSGAGDLNAFSEELGEAGFQNAGNRSRLELPLKAAKISPVVLDGKAKRRQKFA